MADIIIDSLLGGLNDTDPPIMLAKDQCTVADNVEFDTTTLGKRRKGIEQIDGPVATGVVTFLHRHTPTVDETAAELWALWVNGTTPAMHYKDTSWQAVTFIDAIDATLSQGYRVKAQSLHGKLFLAYKSAVDRLHVRDVGASNVRRSGLNTPAAPSVANTGVGTFSGTRYYRVRYTVQSGGVTLRRSEPSDATTFSPSGAGSAARVTKPATISESETHWELEASLDNANFYVIATTVVATTTADDTTSFTAGYAQTFELSEDIGDYTTLHSAKFLTADDDRLLLGGSWEDPALSSRVAWTPVLGDPGSGNDERSPLDTDNFIDLDSQEGGELTGLSRTVNGYIFALKRSAIYQLVRSGTRARAYQAYALSKQIGALPGSIVEGVDQLGRPCLYFVDQSLGPCRAGEGGIQVCSRDVITTWRTINPDAIVITRGVFYPIKRQVIWWIATGDDLFPTSIRMVLQTNLTRPTESDGIRRGWAKWTSVSIQTTSATMFAENIDDNVARSNVLKPFFGDTLGRIFICDTGTTDGGSAFSARIVTAPLVLAKLLNRFGIMSGVLMAAASAGVSILVKAVRDFGLETKSTTVSLSPAGSEVVIIEPIDNLSTAENRVVQIEFADQVTPSGDWHLHQFAFKSRMEEEA